MFTVYATSGGGIMICTWRVSGNMSGDSRDCSSTATSKFFSFAKAGATVSMMHNVVAAKGLNCMVASFWLSFERDCIRYYR